MQGKDSNYYPKSFMHYVSKASDKGNTIVVNVGLARDAIMVVTQDRGNSSNSNKGLTKKIMVGIRQ